MNFPPLPPRFDLTEVQNIVKALKNNKLWPYPVDDATGMVNLAVKGLRDFFGVPYVVPTSSGTASIHTALGGLKIAAGTEVVLPPITDAGTVTPIIFQNAIPVFADVDPVTSTVTAKTVEAVITDKTSAVIVVHLAGCPVDIQPIVDLCKARNIRLIEDAAQALAATYAGKYVGTFGDIGCFSLNDQKHITCGEGGFITVHDEETYFQAHNFSDKYYDRHNRGVRYHGVGLNYRLSELDGAMIISQLPKLCSVIERRRKAGDLLTTMLRDLRGVIPQVGPQDTEHSYFFFMFRFDPQVITKPREAIIQSLNGNGIKARGGYVEQMLYKTKVFREKSFFAGGVWPAELAAQKQYDYTRVNLPDAELANSTTVSFSFHHGLSETNVKEIFEHIRTSLV